MKKYKLPIIAIVIVLGVCFYLFWKTGPNSTSINPNVKILTGQETQNYTGINGYGMYGDFPDGSIKFDPNNYDLSKYNLSGNKELRAYDFPKQNVYALMHTYDNGKTITVQNSILLLDKITRQAEEYLFPESSDATNIAKVGDNIFIRYLHRTDYSKLIPGDNRFYIFDIANRKFRQLNMAPTMNDDIWYKFYVMQNPNNGNTFAVGYCNKNGWDDCAGFGIALSNSQYLKKVMNVDLPFTIGWKNDDLFIKKGDTVYLADPNSI